MILKRKTLQKIISVMLIIIFVGSSAILALAYDSSTVSDSESFTLGTKSSHSSEDIVYNLGKNVLESNNIKFEINVGKTGSYNIGMSYKVVESKTANICIGFMVDGKFPFSDAQRLKYPRMWCNATYADNYDDEGNEYAPQQIPYDDFYYNDAIDETLKNGEKFTVSLTEGVHKITLIPCGDIISIDFIRLRLTGKADAYQTPKDESEFYGGTPVIIEGEDAAIKSSYFFVGKSDSSSILVTPHSAENSLINYIGGRNWKKVGETLAFETPELEAGYYQLGFSFRQNTTIGAKSYRTLLIDGEIPFLEAEKIGFSFNDNWQQKFFADDNDNPYLIYFSKGKHEISLQVTAGDVGEVRTLLSEAVAKMGSLYVDITKITGETVDLYRDYELFKQIGDMQERLEDIRKELIQASELLLRITGEKTGSDYSIIKNMVEVIDQMLDNKFEAHRYKNYYYSNYCSTSSVLQGLAEMPLDLDKIVLSAVGAKNIFKKSNLLEKISFSAKRFLTSFTRDYNNVASGDASANSTVNIWVSWGRDQAQVLKALIERSFTPQTGINVNLKLVNASIIQATLSGNAPDCYLQLTRSEPVNLAMRNVLLNLTQFKDYNDVLKRFQDGADIPYRYNGGLYAIPDTQSFFVLFYRKDILEKYGLEVPKTWSDFDLVAKLLMRNNMSVYLPNNAAADVAQANAGVGTNNIYPTLLLQNGISLYSNSGKSTNLLASDAMQVFEKWTDYYRKLKFPVTLDFYNRFRTGTTPIGISSYNLYTTLEIAAPEIKGLWSITSVPGTLQEDGSVSHATSGGGTGASILKSTKNPEGAWEFIKWWTGEDTQMTYSNDLEAVLGPMGRVCLSNKAALENLSWSDGTLEELLNSWSEVKEIPEFPGSYYVSRSIYQSFWNVVNDNQNAKDMLMKYGKEANDEILRKWSQYTDR